MATLATRPQRSDGEVLTSAIARIADFWGFSNPKLGQVLGLSPATVSRLKGGKTQLDPDMPEGTQIFPDLAAVVAQITA